MYQLQRVNSAEFKVFGRQNGSLQRKSNGTGYAGFLDSQWVLIIGGELIEKFDTVQDAKLYLSSL